MVQLLSAELEVILLLLLLLLLLASLSMVHGGNDERQVSDWTER